MNTRASIAASHFDSARYAITNATLLATPWRGSYLIGTKIKSDTENVIYINPASNIAVKDENVQAMYGQMDAHTNTRTEIQNGKIKMGNERLIAVGGFLNLQDEDGYTGVPLHTRNGKFPMSGKVTQPSGLASELPIKAAWLRINEEFGGVYVHHHTKTIEVVMIEPDAMTQERYPDLMSLIRKNKVLNENNIRNEVAKIYPSTRKTRIGDNGHIEETWKIALTSAPTENIGLRDHLNIVQIDHSEGTEKIPAILFDEPARSTYNINLLLSVKLPGPLETLRLIDMEGFGREARLYSPAEIADLGDKATPALKDFGDRLKEVKTPKPPAAPSNDTSAPVAV